MTPPPPPAASPAPDPRIPPGTRAVILAGGKGTRLFPYTTLLPKPLVPIGDRPILEIVLVWLREAGIRDIILSVGHLAELIQAFFGNGEKWGVRLTYVIEDEPLGTIGPLTLLDGLDENFFVLNGDVLTDLDLGALYAAHAASGATLTVATRRREVHVDFGVLRYEPQTLRIESFVEKPIIPYDVSMGVYLLRKRCLDHVPRGVPFGFDQLVLTLLERGEAVRSFPHSGRWLDVGRPADLEEANRLADTWNGRGSLPESPQR